ncbi:N-acetyl-alpha-D-glucosaminyl L-malate synthase [termite gut metagenome]|uniref:N-acetyl-alpha-D-glucosaminyl L-malate synthase n=1 Tax=termite gut metagenome TaxID=433724 RepID=A0A5J4QCK3_9ZZZZ
MKVLYITHYTQMYGANLSLIQLIIELIPRGIEPIVILPPLKGELFNELKRNNISYYTYRIYSWSGKKTIFFLDYIKGILKCIITIINTFLLFRRLKYENISLIHTNSSVTYIGVYLKYWFKIPHIWHLREFGYKDYQLRYLYGQCFTSFIMNRGGDRFIAISQAIANHYSHFIDKNKIDIIYNGISDSIIYEDISPIRRNQIFQICILGGITEGKNQLEVIKALYILKQRNILQKICLNIVGSGSSNSYLNKITHFIKEKKLIDEVRFWGYQSNITQILINMDMAIVPSICEGFGRVTIEYMLHKVPVIASETGANSELIKSHETGLLYSLEDESALAEAMYELMINENKRIQLAKNAYIMAKAKFISSINTNKIFELYQQILIHSN